MLGPTGATLAPIHGPTLFCLLPFPCWKWTSLNSAPTRVFCGPYFRPSWLPLAGSVGCGYVADAQMRGAGGY